MTKSFLFPVNGSFYRPSGLNCKAIQQLFKLRQPVRIDAIEPTGCVSCSSQDRGGQHSPIEKLADGARR